MPDKDEEARLLAQQALNDLHEKYWEQKMKKPQPPFDELQDLYNAYQRAAVEYAGLEGRLMRDDILAKTQDIVKFGEVREQMAKAKETKELLLAARDLIKLIIAIA
jgi:hypothetical protein